MAIGNVATMMSRLHKERFGAVGDRREATIPDDITLMEAIAARDAAALRALYDRHAGLIYTLCFRILRNRQDAEDLLTDIFWELWDKAARFDPSRSSVATYLTLLARSRALDRLRARPKVATEPIDVAISLGAEPPQDLDERRMLVRRTLQSLDEPQRQVIECAFYEGLSHSQIAAKLDRPLGTVKTYIRQGLSKLRDSLRTLQED